MYLTANPAYHARSKYFETHQHYVRERLALGLLEVKHIPSHLQIADIFTKTLPVESFTSLRFKLGVDVPPTPSLRGANNTMSRQVKMTLCRQGQNDITSIKESKEKMTLGQKDWRPKPNQEKSSCESSPLQRSDLALHQNRENNKAEEGTRKLAKGDCTEKIIPTQNRFDALAMIDDDVIE